MLITEPTFSYIGGYYRCNYTTPISYPNAYLMGVTNISWMGKEGYESYFDSFYVEPTQIISGIAPSTTYENVTAYLSVYVYSVGY